MILFADYNTPYLFAISFVLLIGLLEILALICGHMLSGALDWHPVAACLHHGLAITTVEPVRGSCQFTVYDYCGALYR